MSLTTAPARLTATYIANSIASLRTISSSPPRSSSSAAAATAAVSTTSKHYQSHTTDSYESAYFYSPGEYTSRLAGIVRDALVIPHPTVGEGAEDSPSSKLRKRRRIIDIGGGTGNFTRTLVDHPNSGSEAVVVDPFLERSSSRGEGENSAAVEFVKASAEDFSSDDKRGEWWRSNYHQVMLKEVVHHISDGDRAAVFRGMREGTLDNIPLRAGGGSLTSHPPPPSILIVTRPQTEIDYPLWPEAQSVWAANQPSSDDIESDLREAGYVDVRRTLHPYPCEIELEQWLTMVRNRFWSTFSNFTDDELDEACERMRKERKAEAEADEKGRIRFEDRLVFITGRK